jgi:hypothetical protein
MRLEKDKADMTFALQRAGTDKDHQVVAAKAAASVAEGKLQSLLEELSSAKSTSQAASTTSGLVLKVRWAFCNTDITKRSCDSCVAVGAACCQAAPVKAA